MELKNTAEMRHAAIVIGKAGSGKSSVIYSTAAAIGVQTHTISPKSLTLG